MSLIRSFLSEFSKPLIWPVLPQLVLFQTFPDSKLPSEERPGLPHPPVCMNTAPTSGLTIVVTTPLLWFVR